LSGGAFVRGTLEVIEAVIQISRHIIDIRRLPLLARDALPSIDLVYQTRPRIDQLVVAPMHICGMAGIATHLVELTSTVQIGRRDGRSGPIPLLNIGGYNRRKR